MRQEFELTLCNYTLYIWLGVVGTLTSLCISLSVVSQLLPHSWGFFGMILVFLLCFYALHHLLKWLTLRSALLEVAPTGLWVRYLATGQEVAIAFAEVSSYRDEQLKDGRALRFRLRSGKKIQLTTNHFLGPTSNHETLVGAVEAALAQYNATASLTVAREKSFFEKPFSTLLLVVCAVMLVVIMGQLLVQQRPVTGSFFTAFGVFLTYVGMWYSTRLRHRA